MKNNYIVSYLTLSLEKSVLISDVPNASVARQMAIGLYPAITETSIVSVEVV